MSHSLRQARNKRWRDKFPAHEYQKKYRENHPDYVQRNRELQNERNKSRKKDPAPMIVKTYALMSQMQVQSNLEAICPPNPG